MEIHGFTASEQPGSSQGAGDLDLLCTVHRRLERTSWPRTAGVEKEYDPTLTKRELIWACVPCLAAIEAVTALGLQG
jgi:hypothetical protein